MAERARFRCASLGLVLRLPLWPDDVDWTLPSWNVDSLDRPGRASFDVPTTLTTEEQSVGFMVRSVHFDPLTGALRADGHESMQAWIADLRRLATTKAPVQWLLGDNDTGLWRIESPSIKPVRWAEDGTPSVFDVSLVLKRASEAIVRVGPVKRVKGRGRKFARKG